MSHFLHLEEFKMGENDGFDNMVFYINYRYLARSFHVILPYFATGTMERIDTEGQVATAKVRCILVACYLLVITLDAT